MAIVKVTKSGKGVLFIDDAGNVYITSVTYLRSLLDKELAKRYPFILLNRLSLGVSKDHFKQSPVYNPQTGVTEELTRKNDAFSDVALKKKDESRGFEDKPVEW